ncbi:MAG TPA: helix-hairpin-helix domain-containing protein [Polyangiaceae bacterium]|nr:helix-hairpin-helix domain-containing protein [Polyangiaceae bacterium]
MNITASARRQDQPLKLGAHGYRIEADEAVINAEINVPPYHSGGAWLLQLWASSEPQRGPGSSGTKISEIQFELPTPLANYSHRVEARVPALLPPQGQRYVMSLVLVEARTAGEPSVQDIAQFPEREQFPGPQLNGEVGYTIRGGEVRLHASSIVNPRPTENLSGSLALELWAFAVSAPERHDGERHCLARAPFGCIAGQERLVEIEQQVPFAEPPVGRWQLALLLCEWTQAFGYVTRDRRDFAQVYQRAPEAPLPVAAALPAVTESIANRAAPSHCGVQLRSPRLVSIQSASVEDLAKLKGLNLRIAKEIVRARPFASIDELLRVHGIGRKTLERIRACVTL